MGKLGVEHVALHTADKFQVEEDGEHYCKPVVDVAGCVKVFALERP